jgi:hypothetical protein
MQAQFDTWFDGLVKQHKLKDVKFALSSTNSSVRELKNEFMRLEKMADAGISIPLPEERPYTDDELDSIIQAHFA